MTNKEFYFKCTYLLARALIALSMTYYSRSRIKYGVILMLSSRCSVKNSANFRIGLSPVTRMPLLFAKKGKYTLRSDDERASTLASWTVTGWRFCGYRSRPRGVFTSGCR